MSDPSLMPDAALNEATAAIMGKITDDDVAPLDVNGADRRDDRRRRDTREDREDRDATEREGSGDLEEVEREERTAKGNASGEKGDGDADEEAVEAGAEDDDEQFIELPASEDGKEGERIRLADALEAVQKLRQMDGDITTATIKAEEEAFKKQDGYTQELAKTFATVLEQAKLSLQMMQQYLPQAPDPIMLDENSGYYDPANYHKAKLYYDGYVAHYRQVEARQKQAEEGLKATNGHQDTEYTRREIDRAARYIPEFRDEKAREAKKGEWLEALGKPYGLTKDDLDEITDHRALRLINDFAKLKAAERKAPEIRKAVKETAAKITKGRANQVRDTGTGRYTTDARKELRETGKEDAFARWALRSGLVE